MTKETNSEQPEVLNWRGTVETINEDSFTALLWRNDDIDPYGDNRQATISFQTLAVDSLTKVRRGATFSCITIIPPPSGEPIFQDLVFNDPSPLPETLF